MNIEEVIKELCDIKDKSIPLSIVDFSEDDHCIREVVGLEIVQDRYGEELRVELSLGMTLDEEEPVRVCEECGHPREPLRLYKGCLLCEECTNMLK